MIQKYIISRDEKNDALVIEEYAILGRVMRSAENYNIYTGKFSLINSEKFDSKKIRAAIIRNRNAIISSIRTENHYPIGRYADVLADSISKLYEPEIGQTVELIFDDQDLLQ